MQGIQSGSTVSIQEKEDPIKSKRRDQGNHECEVLDTASSEAAESAYNWDYCLKNPGHTNFISARELKLDHFPEWCRHPSVLENVKTIAALTVRLRVFYTSCERPDGYSFSQHRGSDVLHTGTAWIWVVHHCNGSCQCSECASSSSPHQEWFKLYLETACHVVYNTEEAKCTKVDIFYDDEKAMVEGRARTLDGMELIRKNEVKDNCILLCATHDETLAKHLSAQTLKIENKYPSSKFWRVWFRTKWQRLCVVVSHPHGQPKQMTIGDAGKLLTEEHFTYTADTCPGSSDAPVIVILFNEKGKNKSYRAFLAPHSQWLAESKMNQSGCGHELASLDFSSNVLN
ncbi:hypothetical protein PoB_005152500 [Plakobranchus ocellatus]|uniref:Uncharacterized protein n=1 Tax=Plakobranchus ocellatus TaxID=259542 RepID=A0AAV4C0W9_9GAST|nr:hypothetical protein PoB_005152500 [Plakobranchus ocellatus]